MEENIPQPNTQTGDINQKISQNVSIKSVPKKDKMLRLIPIFQLVFFVPGYIVLQGICSVGCNFRWENLYSSVLFFVFILIISPFIFIRYARKIKDTSSVTFGMAISVFLLLILLISFFVN